jgi:hypothetical protein
MYFILIQECDIVNITRKTNALNEKRRDSLKEVTSMKTLRKIGEFLASYYKTFMEKPNF